MAVCSGSVSLSPQDRVELLALLAADPDLAIAERALSALVAQPPENLIAALERPDAASELFSYCAENLAEKQGVADAMVKNRACPIPELARVASHLSSTGVQALLDDLDHLTSSPKLVAALSEASGATAHQRELIHELQKGPEAEHLEEAVAQAEPDPAKRMTLLQRLSRLTVVERIHMALKGAREERIVLIRDPNKIVQRAVLQSPRLTEPEVESFASMTTLSPEALRSIAANRAFVKNYTVVRNLTSNPKTPLEVSLHLLQRLTPKDLKLLASNRNIPDTLRSSAQKLHRQRTEVRKEF
jgi:hypothetical protein